MTVYGVSSLKWLDQSTTYYFFPYGIGDVFLATSLLSRTPGKKTFIVQEQHVPVMSLTGIANFMAVGGNPDVFIREMDRLGARSFAPVPGKVYVAHPMKNPNERGILGKLFGGMDFLSWYRDYLGTPESTNPYEMPMNIPPVAESTMEKIRAVTDCDVSGLVLLYPFSNTGTNHPASFWEALHDRVKNGKNFVLSNRPVSDSIPCVRLELAESISLMDKVSCIYSNRSGICDIFQHTGKTLTIVYPTFGQTMATYSINKMVGYDKVREFTVADGLDAICRRRFDEA